MAEIAKWAVVALLALGTLLTVGAVGKPREPLKPGAAAVTVLVNALVIAAILTYWGAR